MVALARTRMAAPSTGSSIATGRSFVSVLRLLLVLLLLCSTSTRVLAQTEDLVLADEEIEAGEAVQAVELVPEHGVESATPESPPPLAQRPRLLQPQPLGRVEIRQWPYVHIVHDGQHVYYSPDIRQEYVERALRAISRAHAAAPALMNVPPPEVDYYIFQGQLELRVGLGWIGRIPDRYVMNQVGGVAFQDTGHHVTFMHGDLFRDEADGAWMVAHELTHHLAHRLHGGTDVPAWFEEGNAEYVASQIVRRQFPDQYALETFYRAASIANAARQGVLPALGPLVEEVAWVAASNADRENLLYDTSWQMTEWLASLRNPSAPSRVMGMVGEGRPFAEAFTEIFGMPISEIDRAFLAYANGPMAARYPTGMAALQTTVPANGRAYMVFTGLRPNEAAKLNYRGSECRGEANVSTNQLGFATYWFGEVPDRCVGAFTIQMTGSQGTTSSLELIFTPAAGPVAASAGR